MGGSLLKAESPEAESWEPWRLVKAERGRAEGDTATPPRPYAACRVLHRVGGTQGPWPAGTRYRGGDVLPACRQPRRPGAHLSTDSTASSAPGPPRCGPPRSGPRLALPRRLFYEAFSVCSPLGGIGSAAGWTPPCCAGRRVDCRPGSGRLSGLAGVRAPRHSRRTVRRETVQNTMEERRVPVVRSWEEGRRRITGQAHHFTVAEAKTKLVS